jgi:hypothetical protein
MPPGVAIDQWRDAVDQTLAMLRSVTGSNLLDIPQMVELKVELAQHVRVGCRHPARAVDELAEVWNNVADRGEFLFRDSRSLSGERHPRPQILPSYGATRVAPALNPLRGIIPAGVELAEWRDAIAQTRALVLAVTDSNALLVGQMQKLRSALDGHVERAKERPETVLAELAAIWNEVAASGQSVLKEARSSDGKLLSRPEILRPDFAKPVQ